MIKSIPYSFLFLALVFLVSCAPAKSQSRKDKNKEEKYQEDISFYRTKYVDSSAIEEVKPKAKIPVVPKSDISKNLNERLDTLAKRNSSNKYIQGYRILVYSGRDSKEVQKAKAKAYEVVPEINTYIDFKSPNQRVKVGDCIDRIEAYSLLGKLKKHIPHAVIIPDNVLIKSR